MTNTMTENTLNTGLLFDNSYADQLDGFYAPCSGDKAPTPELIKINQPLAEILGLDFDNLTTTDIATLFSGGTAPTGAVTLAQAYAGHQFGNFSPKLGDGRAILLGEVIDKNNNRQDIHLKGSGRTPFSRGGDGKAALGPVLREYLLGEAMHALHIPTTRALAAILTGERVLRDTSLPGAVLARVASSHLRVGTFQYFAACEETDKIKQLADYTIQRHFPELQNTDDCYLGLLRAVRDKQATLIAKWMLVGFVHGVMNTDNMTISGETIDYGPCAFIDSYAPDAVFSSLDRYSRYAYDQQPIIAKWNLARFAETLLPLINPKSEIAVQLATDEINKFSGLYETQWLKGMREKLGLTTVEDGDFELATDLFSAMENQHVDFTRLFRGLSESQRDSKTVSALFDNAERFDQWHARWLIRLSRDSMTTDERTTRMNQVNPIYIPRNHNIEAALSAAEKESNFEPFETLLAVLSHPFEKREGLSNYASPAPTSFGPYKTFCGT